MLFIAVFVLVDVSTDPTSTVLEHISQYSHGPRPYLGSEADGVKVLPEDFERYNAIVHNPTLHT